MKPKIEGRVRWEAFGTFYGYPNCCVAAFHDDRTELESRVEAGQSTGFVPCADCARLVLKGYIDLKDLIQGRRCKTPFPRDGFLRDVEEVTGEDVRQWETMFWT